MTTEKFFIPAPAPTNDPKEFTSADGRPLKWSGSVPPPSIGSEIHVTMNGIGPAIVTGYFESEGWLGIMMLPINPPKWLVQQRKSNRTSGGLPWQKAGIGCVFGVEFKTA